MKEDEECETKKNQMEIVRDHMLWDEQDENTLSIWPNVGDFFSKKMYSTFYTRYKRNFWTHHMYMYIYGINTSMYASH